MRISPLLLLLTVFVSPLCMAEAEVEDIDVHDLHEMLQDIEIELESRGVSVRDKQGRIKKAQSRMQRLVNRGSWKNAVIGGVLAAAVTAHPAGLLVGGVAGSMVGKSKEYDRVEEKLAVIEREILLDEDDFLTEEEMRLAVFSGDVTPAEEPEENYDDSGETMLVDTPEININDIAVDEIGDDGLRNSTDSSTVASGQVRQYVASNVDADRTSQTQGEANAYQASQAQPERPILESCYGRSAGDRKERERLPHCFYMMY